MFVSIGIGAGIAGPAVVPAVALAALVAAANGSSSAQLAAAYPVSGGTYEYGYRLLHPTAGFMAGWVFLLAKTASAATAALGFAGYTLDLIGAHPDRAVPVAVGVVTAVVALVLAGIRRSSQANAAMVAVTVGALGVFVIGSLGRVDQAFLLPALEGPGAAPRFFEAAALMFVAYTGYGRIATLGEEVRSPARTIPRAILVTLAVSLVLYVAVAYAAVGSVGSAVLATAAGSTAAPLEVAARSLGLPGVAAVVAVGAVTAMLGVLLNLVLGLSRVLLAMGRRGDMPAALARLDRHGRTPVWAVAVVGATVVGLTLTGDVRLTWTFSAFNVLLYYALTNAAALRLPAEQRIYPRWVAVTGLVACLLLVVFVDARVWLVGAGVIIVGVAAHRLRQRLRPGWTPPGRSG